MSERFRFDQRVKLPEATDGKVVVKFFGLPVLVSAPGSSDVFVGNSGITESQLKELNAMIAEKGIGNLVNQKKQVANGSKL